MDVRMPGGLMAYPDMVVVQHPENFTKIIAQVETAETVNGGRGLLQVGALCGTGAPLSLRPSGQRGRSPGPLPQELDIPFLGIRTWRYIVGYDEIEISDHYAM